MADDIIEDFWRALAASPYLMVRREGSREHALPMQAKLDERLGPAYGGAVWFFTQRDNRLAPGGAAMAQFMSHGHELFACASGRLVEETDRELIDRFWTKDVAAWYDGRESPDLLVLRMELDDIEIWTLDLSIKGRLKRMAGIKMTEQDRGEHLRAPV